MLGSCRDINKLLKNARFDSDLQIAVWGTFRLQYEDGYEYELSVLSMRFRFGGREFSKCACSELKTRTRIRPHTPNWSTLSEGR